MFAGYDDSTGYKAIIENLDPDSPLQGFRHIRSFSNQNEFEETYTQEFINENKIAVLAAGIMSIDDAIQKCQEVGFMTMLNAAKHHARQNGLDERYAYRVFLEAYLEPPNRLASQLKAAAAG